MFLQKIKNQTTLGVIWFQGVYLPVQSVRKPLLYPPELRAQIVVSKGFAGKTNLLLQRKNYNTSVK